MKKKVSNVAAYEKKARQYGVKMRQVIDSASGEVFEVAEEVEHRIMKKPVESTLIALAAGFFVGAILGRR